MLQIQTQRLELREFSSEDTDFIIRLLNSPGWLQFIGDRNVKTAQDALHYIHHGPSLSFKNHGFGLMLVSLKEEKIPIGMCGLLKRDHLDFPDIGFAFLPESGGKGYAKEAASAILERAKVVHHLPKVLAITLPENVRSIRLLEELGFLYDQKLPLNEENEELSLYILEF